MSDETDNPLVIQMLKDIQAKLDNLDGRFRTIELETTKSVTELVEKVRQAELKIAELFKFYNQGTEARSKLRGEMFDRFNKQEKERDEKLKKLEEALQENKDYDNIHATEKEYKGKVWSVVGKTIVITAAVVAAIAAVIWHN